MNFQKIRSIREPEFFIEVALGRADKRGSLKREGQQKRLTKLDKSKNIELIRVQVFAETLKSQLRAIRESFPEFDQLDPFYHSLVRVCIDYNRMKKSLGALNWAEDKIADLHRVTARSIRHARLISAINNYRKSLVGRCKSVLHQIRDELAFLESARKILRKFPVIKTDMFTVVLAGFPNVGKSTLLGALTGSTPKIASYPFTTQHLMLGYAHDIQFVDTPGLLDRLLSDRNDIELQAILGLKHLANTILFILDPTEECGYPLSSQLALLKQIQDEFKIPIYVIVNKTDVLEQRPKIPYKNVLYISAQKKQGLEGLWHLLLHREGRDE
ncbi:hypothetical protein GF342_01040 [Candidatus Woesearchaeota archaeon]|nr:hypothetical protein [Candidatus Woesearchaeota archaeon]